MRWALGAAAALGMLLTAACAHRLPATAPAGPTVAEYRAVWTDAHGRRSFRVVAALDPPAGLHLEIPDALGRTMVVVDCDGENLAVAWPRRRRVFRGPADVETFRRLLGAPLDPEGWVALLRGRAVQGVPEGVHVIRRRGGGWPARIEIVGQRGRLVLRLRAVQPLRARGAVADPDRWLRWGPPEPLELLLEQGGLWRPGREADEPPSPGAGSGWEAP